MKGKAEKGDDQPAVLASVGGRQSANTTLKVEDVTNYVRHYHVIVRCLT